MYMLAGAAMESPLPPASSSPSADVAQPAAGVMRSDGGAASQADPFLVEALENPRHRLTVLRMELDIQRFMQSTDQHQFEFQHFASSYLRRAAHRVAQHYGLQTIVLDNILDGRGRIVVRKTPESRFPVACLSDIPAKSVEDEKPGQVKIVMRPRPMNTPTDDAVGIGNEVKQGYLRTMEEREEEYDKARARIFNDSSSIPDIRAPLQLATDSETTPSHILLETEGSRKVPQEPEKLAVKDCSSRVAIFKDREKDRSDPDYDRSYVRYFRGPTPDQNFGLGLYPVLQPPYMVYDSAAFPQLPRAQTSTCYEPAGHIMGSYCTTAGCSQATSDVSVTLISPSTAYAQSFEHFRNDVFQAPSYQHPLSFGYLHKC